jgi:hypothetical protein
MLPRQPPPSNIDENKLTSWCCICYCFTDKLHFCKHPSRMCGPPKCGGPGPKPPHLCNYYHCSSSDCSWEASIEACGDDSSCLSSYYYYQDQNGSSSSSSGSSSSGSSSSSSSGGYDYSGSSSSSSSGGGSDGYDSSSNYDSDGRSGSVSVSNGGSINQIQNSEAATFNPMPYVIGGFLLVGMLAFIVMKKRVSLKNEEYLLFSYYCIVVGAWHVDLTNDYFLL